MEMKKRGLACLAAIFTLAVTLVFTGCPKDNDEKIPPLSENSNIEIHFESFDKEDVDLSKNNENDLVIGSTQTLLMTVPEGYDDYFWYVNGEPWDAGEHFFLLSMDTALGVSVSTVGIHTITAVVQKGNIFYSQNLTFRVVL